METSDERIRISNMLRGWNTIEKWGLFTHWCNAMGPMKIADLIDSGNDHICHLVYDNWVGPTDGFDCIELNGDRFVKENTCHVVSHEPYFGNFGDAECEEWHLSCGHDVFTLYIGAPNYCNECGAKVVNK